ncbi:TetR/AcrR family transcriptional regulator [Nocardia sp. 004]|uniref:TetR/AcrR family transcriptional regulator n=1 Tax=Nocardia sp. 004 TaxID=3385978 RepID=UPI0039A2B018
MGDRTSSPRRRRNPEQTRKAIIDALLETLQEGVFTPTSKTIAARAGVSERSLFVHFHSLEDLLAAVTEQQSRYVEALFADMDAELPLDQRIDIAVGCSEAVFALQRNPRKLGLVQSHTAEAVDQRMRRTDQHIHDSLARLFAPELHRDGTLDVELLDMIDATATWAYRHHLTERRGLSTQAASHAVGRMLRALLTTAHLDSGNEQATTP